MSKNTGLHAAKAAKKDEFYTQLTDIEKEMAHYRDHFKDKVIFCNCDDPDWSNFWRYFHLNFGFLELKKLIATHYDPIEPTYKLEYTGGNDYDIKAGTKTPLQQNGDFRSPECIELLKESDIVVTNPPFSLFREYIGQLMEYKKKFIIIGNINAVTYKEVFPLIKDDEAWWGVTTNGSNRYFAVPDYYPLTEKTGKIVDGVKYAFVHGVMWYTNLDHKSRHEPMTLFRRYADEPERYPKYDNYDAINVDKVQDIPCDYFECIGVPISFLNKYDPDQFEIVGCTESEGVGFSNGLFDQRESETASCAWQESLQADLHQEKIKISRFNDGSYKILPQKDIDLKKLADAHLCDGFTYRSGIMGVPISFLNKYCPEQFEIVAFRKGEDGKDLVFTRERERESSTVLSYPCSTSIPGMIKNAEGRIDGKITYARITIRRK